MVERDQHDRDSSSRTTARRWPREGAIIAALPRSGPGPFALGHQHLLQRLEVLDAAAGADRDPVQRVVGDEDRHAGLVPSRSSRPRSSAPPPVSTMPRSMTSPASSGGHLSSVVFTASTIALTGSSMAWRISSAGDDDGLRQPGDQVAAADLGRSSSGSGNAEPIAILISSAVRSPSASEYSFLTYVMIAWSSSSPATRTDWRGDDAAERDHRDLGGAAADVDDHVAGRLVDRQARADRRGHRLLDDVAPRGRRPRMAASLTARCSTPVMPDGTQTTTRGLAR